MDCSKISYISCSFDYDQDFKIEFKFQATNKHYGAFMGWRDGTTAIQVFGRHFTHASYDDFNFGAWVTGLSNRVNAETTPFNNGDYTYVANQIDLNEVYKVKMQYEKDTSELKLFYGYDGHDFKYPLVTGTTNGFGVFPYMAICGGIGGGAGEFQGTITDLKSNINHYEMFDLFLQVKKPYCNFQV